jgi:hypothetical protein
MGRDFIPEQDAKAAMWMRNFAEGVARQPGAYMLSPADVQVIQRVVGEFRNALALATWPSSRTRGTVCAKNESRARAEGLLRLYAKQIKANAGISDASKISIGVPPPNTSRSRRHVPLTSPWVSVMAATHGAHTLSFGDTITPGRAMPFGAAYLQMFVAITETGQRATQDDARFCGAFTRNPVVVRFNGKDRGKTATYFARWGSRRGEFGNWSSPASFVIAA